MGGYHSGSSSVSMTPSHVSHVSLTSPSAFLAFQQQQQQRDAQVQSAPLAQYPGQQAMGGGAHQKPPSHRRGNSRNGSTSSINLQTLYPSSSSIPGLGMGGMFPPPPTPTQTPSLSSFPSLNGFSHHQRKPSLTMPPPVRIPSLKSEELKLINPFTNQSMSISPTAASSSSLPFPFSSSSSLQTPTALSSFTSSSSSTHRKQPSQDFKYSLSSLASLHSLAPSPPIPSTFPSHHSRTFSNNQSSFNVNFNVTIPGQDDASVPSFESPAVGLFGSGGGVGWGGWGLVVEGGWGVAMGIM